MKVVIEFPDTFDQRNWNYSLARLADDFFVNLDKVVFQHPRCGDFHRHCHQCEADVHADVYLSDNGREGPDEDGFDLRLVPRENCPQCGASLEAQADAFEDVDYAVIDQLTPRQQDRFFDILNEGHLLDANPFAGPKDRQRKAARLADNHRRALEGAMSTRRARNKSAAGETAVKIIQQRDIENG